MTAPDTADLTFFLDMVTSDADQESMTHDPEDCADWRNSCSAHNATRLAGMVRAVLALADEWAAEAKRIDGIFASDEDPWPRTVGGMRAEAFESCAAKLREAITSALTGTPQPSEDENHG